MLVHPPTFVKSKAASCVKCFHKLVTPVSSLGGAFYLGLWVLLHSWKCHCPFHADCLQRVWPNLPREKVTPMWDTRTMLQHPWQKRHGKIMWRASCSWNMRDQESHIPVAFLKVLSSRLGTPGILNGIQIPSTLTCYRQGQDKLLLHVPDSWIPQSFVYRVWTSVVENLAHSCQFPFRSGLYVMLWACRIQQSACLRSSPFHAWRICEVGHSDAASTTHPCTMGNAWV